MFYTKGSKKGPYKLDTYYTKEEGFLKTQAVVLNFLTQKDSKIGDCLYYPNKYIIWLNNLFTSV
jgi:hypothetical protein